jgi:hypothetical protein
MDINYKQKYLKYKYKYLQLQQQGGTAVSPVDNYDKQQEQNKTTFDTVEKSKNDNKLQDIFVLGTHGTQILCSLEEYGINLLKIGKKDKNRFMNCSVIEIYFLPGSNICRISLVYNGELSEEKAKKAKDHEKYFVSDILPRPLVSENINNRDLYKEFKPQYVTIDDRFKKPNKPTRLYLCRHGDGYHTAAKGEEKFLSLFKKQDNNTIFDSNLTDEGITQAKKAADALIEYLNSIKYNQNTDKIYFGASDLLRAIRTINKYLEKYNEKFSRNIKDTVYIIPCSHEIGNCKTGILAWGLNKITNENKTICGYKNERASVGNQSIKQKQGNDDTCEKIDGINIKWDLYDGLFDNVKRGDFNGTTLCSKKNMIDFVVENLQVSSLVFF